MKGLAQRTLGLEEIAALSSRYIDVGTKKDRWEFVGIEASGPDISASARMTSFFVSPTDAGGFHLTIFSAQEMIAQLANIYLQLAAGYETKSAETWMRECSISSRKVIRNPEAIVVELRMASLKRKGDSLAALGNGRVFDDQGGLFTTRLKGLLR